jgi:hypothetical protein
MPVTGVLTLADRVMIGSYAVVLSAFAVSFAILCSALEGHPRVAERIHGHMRALGPLVSCSLFFFAFWVRAPARVDAGGS